eukprot:435734-Rhodomonas_salina.2
MTGIGWKQPEKGLGSLQERVCQILLRPCTVRVLRHEQPPACEPSLLLLENLEGYAYSDMSPACSSASSDSKEPRKVSWQWRNDRNWNQVLRTRVLHRVPRPPSCLRVLSNTAHWSVSHSNTQANVAYGASMTAHFTALTPHTLRLCIHTSAALSGPAILEHSVANTLTATMAGGGPVSYTHLRAHETEADL